MATSYSDRARSLQYGSERDERRRLLREPHIEPLTEFVNRIRMDRGKKYEIPYFDPCDGGIYAKVLFLLEAPGPKALESGFISRNNNDKTAENMLYFLKKAGISREFTILWNIVPWFIGDGGKIRAASKTDIEDGAKFLNPLIELLPNLKAIVLVGGKAQQAISYFQIDPGIKIFETMHPSQRVLNAFTDADEKILTVFKEVSKYISSI